ncbi:hypothetical protein J6590_000672 [Homalodisca vitripennis]|nr:hypothetical protein J6590_000672 [Homalodisca vitripennis]
MYLDRGLTWDNHVDHTCGKIASEPRFSEQSNSRYVTKIQTGYSQSDLSKLVKGLFAEWAVAWQPTIHTETATT